MCVHLFTIILHGIFSGHKQAGAAMSCLSGPFSAWLSSAKHVTLFADLMNRYVLHQNEPVWCSVLYNCANGVSPFALDTGGKSCCSRKRFVTALSCRVWDWALIDLKGAQYKTLLPGPCLVASGTSTRLQYIRCTAHLQKPPFHVNYTYTDCDQLS